MTSQTNNNDSKDIKEQLLQEIIVLAFKIQCEFEKEKRERQEFKDKIKVITFGGEKK